MFFFRKTQHLNEQITEYRKNTKIYDVFTFFNELDLLEIRLNILCPHVDYFIIIECTETFSGLPKKLYYEENKERFKKFQDKIIHFVVDDTPTDENDLRRRLHDSNCSALDREIITNTLMSGNVPKGVVHWLKEFYQKEMMKKALIGLSDNDICYISDVDEIWNPEIIIDYSKNKIYRLGQLSYAYFLNNRSNEYWEGTLVTRYSIIKKSCLNHLRIKCNSSHVLMKNGGWHFTNQGGAELIRKKIEASYSQNDFNKDEIKSKIQERILDNQDYLGRKYKFWTDEKDLPKYILDHKDTYRSWFK